MRYCLLFLFLIFLFSCKQENFNLCYDTECNPDEYCVDGTCVKADRTENLSFKSQPQPRKIIISNLVVTRYNDIKFGGLPYDDDSRPDIYIIATQNSVKIYDFPTFNNAQSAPLPIPLPVPFEITNVFSPLVFNFYDDDGNKTDEFMGGVIFQIFRNDSYPARFGAGNASIGLAFDLAYEF